MENDIRKLKKQFRKNLFSSKMTTEESRKRYEELLYSPHIPNNVDVSEKELKKIPTDILKPEISVFGRTILYAHGGAFVAGSRKAYRTFCATLANIASANLYLPEYRLSPEYPFPTALEDLYSVYAKMIESEKVQPENLILIGDGAGAALILSLINYLKDKKLPTPAMLVLISPWADISCENENLRINRKKDFMLSREALYNAANLYTYEDNLKNKLVSPMFANFKGFPKTIIQCGGNEILLSDAQELELKYEEDESPCELTVYENMPHLFQALPDYFEQAHLAVEKIGRDIAAFFEAD